jgi:hypothetical protein
MGPNPGTDYPYFSANFWQDWERPCHFEMIESSGEQEISVDAGVKIFGNWSRANAQKSMAIHCRKSYGSDMIKYKLFEDRPFDEFKNIVIRNSGNDWNQSMFRDGLMTSLTIGLNFDQMAFRPSIFFLNGEYWGILNIREKIDEHFIASNNGVNSDDVIMGENENTALNGTNADWVKLNSFIGSKSLTVQANYDQVASQIDIASFTDYLHRRFFMPITTGLEIISGTGKQLIRQVNGVGSCMIPTLDLVV